LPNDTRTEYFKCSLLRGTAVVRITDTQDDQAKDGLTQQFACDQCRECGVGTFDRQKQAWSYHWGRCVHPIWARNDRD